jgi:hypothetical protein
MRCRRGTANAKREVPSQAWPQGEADEVTFPPNLAGALSRDQ